MRVTRPIEARHVEIQVKGKEKASFLDTEMRIRNGKSEYVIVKRKVQNEFLHFTAPCFTFGVPVLMPGDYVIPFSFALPHEVPSSMFYKSPPGQRKKASAKVKYHVKCIVHCNYTSQNMKYKQILMVNEAPQ